MGNPEYGRLVAQFSAPHKQYGELAAHAEGVLGSGNLGRFERAVATVILAYSLLRQDPHRHQTALETVREAAADLAQHLEAARSEVGDDADWGLYTYALCETLCAAHERALLAYELVLRESPSLSLRVKALSSKGFSHYRLEDPASALASYEEAVRLIDREPADRVTSGLLYERQRLAANLADHYLVSGNVTKAQEILSGVDERYTTPLILASILVTKARLALRQYRTEEADQLACKAVTMTDYTPVRIDALGVRITVAGLRGRYQEQAQMAMELATLSTYRRCEG